MWTACFDGLPPRALWGKALFIQGGLCRPLFSPPPHLPRPHLIPNVISLCCHLSPFRVQHEQLFPPGHSLVTDPARQHCLIVSRSVSDGGKNCFCGLRQFGICKKGWVPPFPKGGECLFRLLLSSSGSSPGSKEQLGFTSPSRKC